MAAAVALLSAKTAPAQADTSQGQAIVNAAQQMENAGYPYCFDGGNINGPTVGINDPGSDSTYSNCSQIGKVGFDCTGLTLYSVYQGTGNASLSHDGHQATSGGGQVIANQSDLLPGDIVYFDYNTANGLSYIDHAGIYMGSGNVLSAASEHYGIVTESFSWYASGGLHFVGGVRYWSAGGSTTPPAGNGGSAVTNPGSGRCLDVTGASSSLGTPIQIFDCNGSAAQQWLLVNGALQVYANECLDITGGNLSAGTRVQLWSCNGTGAQQWTPHANGTITTSNGLCLDVVGGATGNGTPVQIMTCNGTAAQQWAGHILPSPSPSSSPSATRTPSPSPSPSVTPTRTSSPSASPTLLPTSPSPSTSAPPTSSASAVPTTPSVTPTPSAPPGGVSGSGSGSGLAAPQKPSGFTAVIRRLVVTLSWRQSAAGGKPSRYLLQWATCNFTSDCQRHALWTSKLAISLDNLRGGHRYYFRVAAYNASGRSGFTRVLSALPHR